MTNYNERLDKILTKLDRGEYLGEGGVYTARTAITSLIKELVAEAKINELEKIEIGGDNIWTVDSGSDTAMLIKERIAELKAQQEEL